MSAAADPRAAFVVVCLLVITAMGISCGLKSGGQEILAKVRSNHPRLMMTSNTIATIQASLPNDPWLRRRYRGQKERADRVLAKPVSTYQFKGTDGLLDVSRQVLDRVATLALVYRIEGDRKYLDRCWAELDAAAHFPDWDPHSFLSTAEMTAAFAIGYDWLYEAWTVEQRQVLRQAIINLGLKPGLSAYTWQKWPRLVNNHNTVDNGGLALGALAIADESPEIAGKILARGLVSVRHSLSQFAPDGAWSEGPMYWGYTTEYESMYLDSLETACGTDFGLGDIPGVDKGGWFPLYDNGPVDGSFNYGDAEEDRDPRSGPPLLWMARRFHEPRYAQFEIEHPNGRVSALDVIWGAGIDHQAWQTIEPDRYFRGVELATMRDGWEKTNGWFVGFKAGANDVSHSHLDVGSFVLETKGVRWAIDLGPDDYDLPGYFDDDGWGRRWTYYRLRAEGHNTLVINPGHGPDQDPKGAGKITSFTSTPQGVELTADLTGVYQAADQVVRSLSFLRGQRVKVHDAIELRQPGEVWWFLQTRAHVEPSNDGRTVILSQQNQTLTLQLLDPISAKFEIGPSEPLPTSPHPPKQAVNPGVNRIAIHLVNVKDATISVQFEK
jgi:hypothetical protein